MYPLFWISLCMVQDPQRANYISAFIHLGKCTLMTITHLKPNSIIWAIDFNGFCYFLTCPRGRRVVFEFSPCIKENRVGFLQVSKYACSVCLLCKPGCGECVISTYFQKPSSFTWWSIYSNWNLCRFTISRQSLDTGAVTQQRAMPHVEKKNSSCICSCILPHFNPNTRGVGRRGEGKAQKCR